MSTKKDLKKSAKSTTAGGKTSNVWTDEERAAMTNRAQELKAEARVSKNKEEGENAVLAAIAAMPEPDRAMAKRIHAIIQASAPALLAKTWYGMPAYTNQDGKVVCDFKGASKFKSRYATLEFQDAANLDDREMWSVAFALKELTTSAEAKIAALVKKAATGV